MPTKYVIVNKETEEVKEVKTLSFGTEEVTVTTVSGEEVVFSNIGQVGNLENEIYSIQEVK